MAIFSYNGEHYVCKKESIKLLVWFLRLEERVGLMERIQWGLFALKINWIFFKMYYMIPLANFRPINKITGCCTMLLG